MLSKHHEFGVLIVGNLLPKKTQVINWEVLGKGVCGEAHVESGIYLSSILFWTVEVRIV